MWNTRREKFVKIRNIARKYHSSNCCCCVNKISWLGVWKMERNLLFVNYIFQGIIIISCWLKNSIRALHFFRQFRRNDSNTCFFFFSKILIIEIVLFIKILERNDTNSNEWILVIKAFVPNPCKIPQGMTRIPKIHIYIYEYLLRLISIEQIPKISTQIFFFHKTSKGTN